MTAQASIVNWTHRQATGIGPSSSDPNGSYVSHAGFSEQGEDAYGPVQVRSAFNVARGSMIAVLADGANSTISPSSPAELTANADGTWYVGLETNRSSAAGPMTHQESVGNGLPRLDSEGGVASIVGNVTLYVWGGTVEVEDANGNSTYYQTGVWAEDYEGSPVPQQAVKEEHQQLLRLNLTNAEIRLEQDSGLVEAVGDEILIDVDGQLVAHAATGELRRGDELYVAAGQDVILAGALSATARATHGDAGALHLSLDASEGAVAGPDPTNRNLPAGLTKEDGTTAPDSGIIKDPGENRPDAAWLAAAFAILPAIAAGSTWLIMRTRERKVPPATAKIIAEEAIAQNQPKEARRWIRSVLRKDPTDVDAWFTYGASLAQEKRYRELREELGPRFGPAGKLDSPSVCFLLGLAATKEDDEAAANRWLNRASRDPVLRHRIEIDPMFSAFTSPNVSAARPEAEMVAYA